MCHFHNLKIVNWTWYKNILFLEHSWTMKAYQGKRGAFARGYPPWQEGPGPDPLQAPPKTLPREGCPLSPHPLCGTRASQQGLCWQVKGAPHPAWAVELGSLQFTWWRAKETPRCLQGSASQSGLLLPKGLARRLRALIPSTGPHTLIPGEVDKAGSEAPLPSWHTACPVDRAGP